MRIAGDAISEVKATPSSGVRFGGTPNYNNRYVRPADGFYTNSLPLFCISPPVLNCDDVLFYVFPTSGTTSMLGRQTSGLWCAESTVDANVFYTGNYTFDTKVAATKIVYDNRTTTYAISQAPPRSALSEEIDTDITNYTTTQTDEDWQETLLFGGNPLDDPNHASFVENDPAIDKYEVQYGTNGPANYGPFNLSTSDLVSVQSLTNQEYRQVALADDVPRGEIKRSIIETPAGMIAAEAPWTYARSSEFPARITNLNVHISFSRGFLQGGLI